MVFLVFCFVKVEAAGFLKKKEREREGEREREREREIEKEKIVLLGKWNKINFVCSINFNQDLS